MSTIRAAGFRHLSPTKDFVIGAIERFGPKEILGEDFEGTKEEAIAQVRAAPGQFIAPEGCDNFDVEKGCLGHRRD